ncbi:MAG: FtsK/SpoIIIE domain-containing protein [Actinomycetota bacterium]|nr:FtsK/SpoIIIE domain-containing protein [Actinomycetota bacterium]MDQ2956828.1 FtsK/SpoIIIE domain-containing protein [Actinomycetota bacterium]
MLLALLLSWSTQSSELLLLALLSPITAAGSVISGHLDWRHGSRTSRARWLEQERAARDELALRLSEEAERRRRDFPDAATIMHAVETPDCRLWERRPLEDSFLYLRLGVADQAAEAKASRSGQDLPPSVVTAAPATLSLTDGPVGIAGPLPLARASARWLVAQVLALHSPAEVNVIALLDGSLADWRWLRWPTGVHSIATTSAQRQHAVHDLIRLVAERRSAAGTLGSRWSGPWTVLLIDPATLTATLAGLQPLLADGPAVGVTAICVGQDARLLPPFCRSIAETVSETGSDLKLTAPDRPAFRAVADRVSGDWVELFARRLAPLRDVGTDRVGLPSQISLAELFGFAELNPQAVMRRWAAQTGGPSCPVGMGANGPFELDLVRDGPHVLIAGTTGSGKSELLRSLVVGLAASYPPSEVTFVLIDYKGGAAFAECARLPHTLGVVTDLDSHLTCRALTSLDAELRRREVALAEAGASNLDDYRLTSQAIRCPLPRLVLVIDEFASLAEELPDFLSGLLSIAQRGRSLGIHLVLATQRPAGVVSLDIKANISLRIALRVTDPSESGDVIGNDAASRIPKQLPGRALANTADGVLVEFQTARAGLLSTSTDAIAVTPLDFWHNPVSSSRETEPADLQPICGAISSAASLDPRPIPAPPWLAPLPAHIAVGQLEQVPANSFDLRFGLTDDPARQRQYPAVVELTAGGSIGFIGGARSGRSTALRTLLGLAVSQLSADQLHLYLIDCAGHGFGSLNRLPHCGAVVGLNDPSSVARLVDRLISELARRKRVLAELGVDNVREAHRLGAELPVLLLAIDGWEGLVALSDELDAGRTVDLAIQLLRDGAAAGLTIALAGDRGVLGARVSSAISRKFVLAMTDRGDYAMAGLNSSMMPAEMLPGRAFCVEDGLETQLALLAADPAVAAQWAYLHRNAIRDRARTNTPSVTVRTLPDTVAFAELAAAGAQAPGECLLGLGGDEVSPVFCELFRANSRFLVAGPARSGRSATAVLIARQAHAAGVGLLIAAPRRSALAIWGHDNGYPVAGPHPERPALLDPGQLTDRQLILIDDAEQFSDTAVGDQLHELLRRHHAAAVVCARTDDLLVSFRGIGVEMRRHRTGLLLQPARSDGELLGIRLDPGRLNPPPGRGVLITDRTRQLSPNGFAVQVAI